MSEPYSEAEAREIIRQSVLIEEAYRQGRSDEKYSLAYAPPVFEKALGEATVTPTVAEGTTDEREALVAILEAPLTEESRGRTFSEMLADVILVRFGFRRSEVPQLRGMSDQIHALLDEMNEGGGRINYSDYSVLHGMVSQLANAESQGEPSDAQVEFPFTHEGVTLEQDDGGLWVQLDANEFTTGEHHPYWIGPRALAALRAAFTVGEVR